MHAVDRSDKIIFDFFYIHLFLLIDYLSIHINQSHLNVHRILHFLLDEVLFIYLKVLLLHSQLSKDISVITK